MMEIFLLQRYYYYKEYQGCQKDYESLLGVFSSKEKAREHLKTLPVENESCEYFLQEVTLDEPDA